MVRIIDLGTLGGTVASANRINNRGQIVGTMETAVHTAHPFLWYRGVTTDLGTLGGDSGSAIDVNERGHVAGTADTASGEHHAFLWRDGRMIDLGTLGGNASNATLIDGQDQVVGRSFDANGTSTPFVWRDGVMRPLTAPGWTNLNAEDMSENGHVVGTGTNPDGVSQAFHWYRGRLTGLSFPDPGPGLISRATFVNERGEALGLVIRLGVIAHRTVFWDARGRATTIGDVLAEPSGLNDRGHAVGSNNGQGFLWRCGKLSVLPGGPRLLNNRDDVVLRVSSADPDNEDPHWAIWRRGTVRRLATLAPETVDDTVTVLDINERGQIVGMADVEGNGPHAVLWNT